MIKSKAVRVALVGAIAASLVGATFSAASAAEPNGSVQPYFILDGNTGEPIPEGTVLDFNQGVIASPVKTDVEALFNGPADATEVVNFLSPRGQESNISQWTATGAGGFFPGTKNVLQPSANLGGLTNGGALGAKANGGQFSLGIAFTLNTGVTIASTGPSYVYITIQPGGNWTFEYSPTTPTTPAGQSEDIDLSAEVGVLVDGALSLEVPAGASAAIGTPVVANGTSTSTGVLGNFTVKDARAATHKGWTLTSVVSDFVAGSVTLPAASLSVKPKIVSTSATGVTVAAEAAASTAGTPFADATDAAQVGDTVLNADLTFAVPSTTAAGTYTSKMTLTLVSK